MGETVAEVAARIGIPVDKLEDLIELPAVSDALVTARSHPNKTPEQIWHYAELPVIDPDGLDIAKLERELMHARELGEKGDGSQAPLDQRINHPILRGKLQQAEEIARRRLEIISEVSRLMRDHYAEPQSMDVAKRMLANEIERSER
jgi:hypothetical protein